MTKTTLGVSAFLLGTLAGGCASEAPYLQKASSPEPSPLVAPPREKTDAKSKRDSESETPSDAEDEQVGAPQTTRAIPDSCREGSEECAPPRGFSESLCRGKYPSLALVMFEKASPWQRLWVNQRELQAVNAHGGSNAGGPLTFGEEVVLLGGAGGGASGGIQVSGADDVQVLRYNGTCVTVRRAELVTYVPGLPKSAPIIWKYLESDQQEALLENGAIARARSAERKQCRSSSARNMSKPCEKATEDLSGAIAVALRQGIALGAPEKVPEWVE